MVHIHLIVVSCLKIMIEPIDYSIFIFDIVTAISTDEVMVRLFFHDLIHFFTVHIFSIIDDTQSHDRV